MDIDAGDALVERIKPLARATRRAGRDGRPRRLRRAVRPEGGRVRGPGAGLHHRRRRHQAEDRHRDRAARDGRHRPGRDVRQRPGRAGRRAAVLPGLFRHRASWTWSTRGHGGRRASPRAAGRPAARWSAARRRRCPGCTRRATTTWPASPSARPSAARCCRAASAPGDARAGLREQRRALQRLLAGAPDRRAAAGWAGTTPAPVRAGARRSARR